ncbi:MAG: tetratricopeptide repeat protein [Spirochaetaceae bacterium]|jgi:putative GTP pyrophosphokinase|nr:tetratricopeptide repeat protein [Spirochaetaceae bacterium]
MAFVPPDRNRLQKNYEKAFSAREHVLRDITGILETAVQPLSSRPTIKGRIKEFDSYYKKYLKLLKETPGIEPVITDLLALRIICPFLEDLSVVEKLIRGNFSVTELDRKGAHFSFKEFGYESIHLLIQIPLDLTAKWGHCGVEAMEIQVRTILQDAWAEVEHELVYKAEFTPFDDPLKRRLAAVNASLSLADSIFQEIRSYQRQLNREMGKRRDSFYRKIEDSTDGLLFEEEHKAETAVPMPLPEPNYQTTIDDLLLNALYAHNQNRFAEAIAFYSRILDMNPAFSIVSLIYKHRGMAYFAQSKYEEAIEDFTKSLEFDKTSYKSAYYRGVVRSVLQEYAGAVDDFTLSLEINPYQNFTLYRRGQAYYHLEDYPAALADCNASLALDPKFETAIRFRSLLLDKLKMRG